MEKQEMIYITGHQHPDTDSVASAIAYAFFKRARGIRAVACRLGDISNETKYLLNRFGYEEPMLLSDARKKLSEITIDPPLSISPETTIYETIRKMHETERSSFGVTDPQGHLIGFVSKSDLANMGLGDTAVSISLLAKSTVGDIADTISGTIVYDDPEMELNGKVSIIALAGSGVDNYELKNRIVIMGDDKKGQLEVIEKEAGMLIIVWAKEVSEEVVAAARVHHCPIILSGHGTMNTSRFIFFAPQVHLVMNRNPYVLREDEYAEEAGRKMMKNRFRNYPVVDRENRLVGYAARFHIMNAQDKSIIMVDHNEFSQSVRSVEKARILEVVDHHRISDFATSQPVSFRNEIVGSTATIIAGMFRENQIPIPQNLAGLLLGAILSDTLIFQSPTTTKKDWETANVLAALADVDAEEFGREMFTAAISEAGKSMNEQIVQDIKYYEISGYRAMISQVMTVDLEEYRSRGREIQQCADKLAKAKDLDLLVVAFSSVTEEGSMFFAAGEKASKCFEAFPDRENETHSLHKGVLSRKMQILPMLEQVLL